MRVSANQLDLNAATRTTVISGFGGMQLKTQNESKVNASILVFPYKKWFEIEFVSRTASDNFIFYLKKLTNLA